MDGKLIAELQDQIIDRFNDGSHYDPTYTLSGLPRVELMHHIEHELTAIWESFVYLTDYGKKYQYIRDMRQRGVRMATSWFTSELTFRAWYTKQGYEYGQVLQITDELIAPKTAKFTHPIKYVPHTKTNKKYTYDGERRTLMEWETEFGLASGVLQNRLDGGAENLHDAIFW